MDVQQLANTMDAATVVLALVVMMDALVHVREMGVRAVQVHVQEMDALVRVLVMDVLVAQVLVQEMDAVTHVQVVQEAVVEDAEMVVLMLVM